MLFLSPTGSPASWPSVSIGDSEVSPTLPYDPEGRLVEQGGQPEPGAGAERRSLRLEVPPWRLEAAAWRNSRSGGAAPTDHQ